MIIALHTVKPIYDLLLCSSYNICILYVMHGTELGFHFLFHECINCEIFYRVGRPVHYLVYGVDRPVLQCTGLTGL